MVGRSLTEIENFQRLKVFQVLNSIRPFFVSTESLLIEKQSGSAGQRDAAVTNQRASARIFYRQFSQFLHPNLRFPNKLLGELKVLPLDIRTPVILKRAYRKARRSAKLKVGFVFKC